MKVSKKSLYSAMTMTMLIGASLAPVAQTIPGMVVRAETVKTVPEKRK